MYSLNLAADNRILSACVCLPGQTYENIVDTLPDGDVSDYKYVNGGYVYDPLPEPEPAEQEPTLEDRMEAAEANIDYIALMADIEISTEE